MTLTTSASASVDEHGAAPGARRRRTQDLGAGLEALDGDGDALGDVGRLDLELEALRVDGDDGLGSGLALDVDRDVDGDLLALGGRRRGRCAR